MDSVSFDSIEIKVIAREVSSQGEIAEDWLDVPPNLDAGDVEDFVVGRFGEPLDLEVDSRSEDGEVVRGWVFPVVDPALVRLPLEGAEMIVVPFVRFRDGSRRELFDYTAELDREFRALAQSVDPLACIPGSPVPERPGERLEDESLHVYSIEQDLLELQIEGWLGRVIEDGHTYVVLDLAATGRYVQFVTYDGAKLRGEVSGDLNLAPRQHLTSTEHRELADLGWLGPASSDDDCGNYWLNWDPDRVRDGAGIAARTLCNVFRVADRYEIEVTSGPAWRAGD